MVSCCTCEQKRGHREQSSLAILLTLLRGFVSACSRAWTPPFTVRNSVEDSTKNAFETQYTASGWQFSGWFVEPWHVKSMLCCTKRSAVSHANGQARALPFWPSLVGLNGYLPKIPDFCLVYVVFLPSPVTLHTQLTTKDIASHIRCIMSKQTVAGFPGP